ncbi:hypothetical protein P8452_52081 [Trifolium repens]|nr:hypothetical protein P8452_52081 [Trifolium repens]
MPHKAGEVTQTNTRRSHTDKHQLNINPEGFGEATQSNARTTVRQSFRRQSLNLSVSPSIPSPLKNHSPSVVLCAVQDTVLGSMLELRQRYFDPKKFSMRFPPEVSKCLQKKKLRVKNPLKRNRVVSGALVFVTEVLSCCVWLV